MIGANYNDLIGEKYVVAEKWFKDVGFNNIKRNALKDIYVSGEDIQWQIADITINGYKRRDWKVVGCFSFVIAVYHTHPGK
jgi:hypothetical protein